jgi:glycosyltransferase involved in cell wall biosynthesis
MISFGKRPASPSKPQSPEAPGSALGMYFDGMNDQLDQAPVYGAQIATEGFFDALMRYGQFDRYELFAKPGREAAAAAYAGHVARETHAGPGRLRVHGYQELQDRFDGFNVGIWHDPGAHFSRMFHLRSIRSRTLVPVTFTHHTLSYAELAHEWLLPLLLADSRPCDSVICTSRASRESLRRLLMRVSEGFQRSVGCQLEFNGRLDVIPLGVDTDLFRPRDQADARRQLGLPAEPLIILWFGRFSLFDKMDLLPLLRVMKKLVTANPNRKLLLLLAGTERAGYATTVQRYAQTLGIAGQVMVRKNFPSDFRHLLYSAADIFVSPVDNIQETFGITPVEALACGIPQVVSDWDGYRDTVVHGQTGILVPTTWTRCDSDLAESAPLTPWEFDHLRMAQSVAVDLEFLQTALQKLIDHDELRQQMARNSRERAVAQFSWPAVIRKYEELWAELRTLAGNQPFEAARRTAYLHAAYFDCFSPYATRCIDESARIRLTDDGKQLMQGREPLPDTLETWGHLDGAFLKQMAVTLGTVGRLQRRYTLGSLISDLSEPGLRSEQQVRRSLMWLVKYGYVAVEAGET